MRRFGAHKTSGRILAFLLSLALVAADLTILPVTASAEETGADSTTSSGNASSGQNGGADSADTTQVSGGDTSATEFTLEASALTAFDKGAKADGDTEEAGTDDYFTVIYSAKSKVDSSSKEFDDDYTSNQRINFGGKATTDTNVVKFTTGNAATVKVWWVEGGDDNRQMEILNASGDQVAITDVTLAKNATCISTFSLTDAGTYYLGGATNNNYIFKIVVTEEKAAEPTTSILDTTADLTAAAQGSKADGDEEKAGTDSFFTIIYSGKSKVDSSSKDFTDGYTGTQRLNLGGKVTTGKNAVKFTTGSAATVKVWWVEGGDDNRQMTILNTSGEQVAITDVTLAKNGTCISEFSLTDAGTYYLGGATGNNYIFKVEVVESNGSAEKERAAWSDVAAPVISAVTVNDASIDVTVQMVIGDDGADSITVTMTDADGEATTKKSSKEGSEVTLNFVPTASGTYTFSVVASREDEEDKAGAETKNAEFVLPLTAPVLKSATSKGGGSVEVAWNAVDEAESYIITVDGTDISVTTTELETTITGLTVGQEYTFRIVAVRGEEQSEASTISATVAADEQRTWVFAAFGQGINTTDNGYEGSVNDDGQVTVYSVNGKGKIVPGSNDGLAFYYTTIDPETENFTLTADIHVDEWKFSNGQEGFGLMVADAVGENGSSTNFWNNSYQALASKIEYTTDEGNKITMKLGIGANVRLGVTAQDVVDFKTGAITMPAGFTTTTDTLETSCASLGAGTYNIIGNYYTDEKTSAPTGTQETTVTDIKLQIQRNNTGYYLRYLDSDGNIIGEQMYYDLERNALTQIDTDNIYVGFFASRNARITVSNIELTTISPEDDEAAEEREIEYLDLTSTVESATYANSSSYEFVYVANADGVLNLKDSEGNVIFENYAVTANEKVKKTITLSSATTTLSGTFTPNADYQPSEYSKLSSYDTVAINQTITLQASTRTVIYVSPDGTADGIGSKEDPMSVYQAVKVAAPGTHIYIMEGTYYLDSTVKVERGINGTTDSMIYMIADPEAETRPVFDFQSKCAGMVLAGDYWYFQGFDVTNSADAQKGIQVSGDHNVLDRICAYKNGNTGIQISRYKSTDEYEDWPAYNTILNCSSYLNADKGYEDADGFAAKLTVGDGNVFDGCIAAYNADDGWDLFAKVQTGSIGVVTIQNCVAFKNGYVLDENGNEVNAGNGNGFKMGGDSMAGAHILKNSIAFGNKAKGIDSNSGPDIQVYDSISFNNESYNVALYTNTAVNTNYIASGIISYKNASGNTTGENLKFKGTQDETLVKNANNFFFDGTQSVNTAGTQVTDNWFVSVDMAAALSGGISRNEDGTINMNGFLVLTNSADDTAQNATIGGNASATIEKKTDPADSSSNTDGSDNVNSSSEVVQPSTQNPASTESDEKADEQTTVESTSETIAESASTENAKTGENSFGLLWWILGVLAVMAVADFAFLIVLRKKEEDSED